MFYLIQRYLQKIIKKDAMQKTESTEKMYFDSLSSLYNRIIDWVRFAAAFWIGITDSDKTSANIVPMRPPIAKKKASTFVICSSSIWVLGRERKTTTPIPTKELQYWI